MKPFRLIICILSFLPIDISFGQQQVCLDFKAHLGTLGLSFDENQNQLDNKSNILNANSLFVGFQYKIKNHFAIGFHFFDQKYNWEFGDNIGVSLNNGDYVKMKVHSTNRVQGFSGNINYNFPIKGKDKLNWILGTGYSYGKIKPTNGSSEFNDYAPEISIIQEKKSELSSVFIETGIGIKPFKRIEIDACLGYFYCLNNIYECSYILQTQSINSNTTIKSSFSGAYLGVSLSYSLFNFRKKERKKHFVPEYNDKNEVAAINGRKVNSSKEITAKNNLVQIQVWDHGDEDGDKISLFLNDIRILKKYKLTHKKKQIQAILKPGKNKLIVYAHNLGKEPPNTASVSILDGNEKHVLFLESTLGECGAIDIYCNP